MPATKLLVVSAVLDAIMSGIYLAHYTENRGFRPSSVLTIGILALAAGICTIAAVRSTQPKSWLLVLNGLALAALGLLCTGIFGSKISFRSIAILLILMAVSLGVFELVTARTFRNRPDGWLLTAAGVLSVGFAILFALLGFQWIQVQPGSLREILWLGAYFGFTAICLLAAVIRGVIAPNQMNLITP